MDNLRTNKIDGYTLDSGYLDVGDGHQVWYEQWGNSSAKIPILIFHGGPGGEFKAKSKQRFNPLKHQIIYFDQRGSGNSLPYGETKNNTTNHLISDALKILQHLSVNRVYLLGSSWGSTLAVIFNIKYPAMVAASVVGGIYLGSKQEIEYVSQGYFRQFYPEVWQRFLENTPTGHHDNPAKYHYSKLANGSKNDKIKSAQALQDLEFPLLTFNWQGYGPSYNQKADNADEEYDFVPYKIYAHYMSHDCFLPDNYILNNANQITNPLAIVQGRYDMVCPPATAYKLHQAVNNSKLYITLDSHSGSDPENRTATRVLIDSLFV